MLGRSGNQDFNGVSRNCISRVTLAHVKTYYYMPLKHVSSVLNPCNYSFYIIYIEGYGYHLFLLYIATLLYDGLNFTIIIDKQLLLAINSSCLFYMLDEPNVTPGHVQMCL